MHFLAGGVFLTFHSFLFSIHLLTADLFDLMAN